MSWPLDRLVDGILEGSSGSIGSLYIYIYCNYYGSPIHIYIVQRLYEYNMHMLFH